MRRLFAVLMISTGLVIPALAEPVPAIIYDFGGKFDKSFNEAMSAGAERFKAETGKDYVEFEITNDAQREQALRRFAEDGRNPIVMISVVWKDALTRIATEFPATGFVVIDMVVDKPNVKSVLFKEEEGSYLAGLMAGMASTTKKVGFVGGMDLPLIRRFGCAYKGGAKAAGASEVIQTMTGVTPDAFNDPAKGAEIARTQIDQGADVIFAAAGGTGIGVLQAAGDAGKLGIGVDSNQNGLVPGKVLTSMVKRLDHVVYDAFVASRNGGIKAGVSSLGLKEGGVDIAMDSNNEALVTSEMMAVVNEARAGIISGEIKVHDYVKDSTCPY